MDRPEDVGIRNPQVVQITQLVLEGENAKGEKVQILLDSNRRPIPVPYSEEP